jgi:hypothetical protein
MDYSCPLHFSFLSLISQKIVNIVWPVRHLHSSVFDLSLVICSSNKIQYVLVYFVSSILEWQMILKLKKLLVDSVKKIPLFSWNFWCFCMMKILGRQPQISFVLNVGNCATVLVIKLSIKMSVTFTRILQHCYQKKKKNQPANYNSLPYGQQFHITFLWDQF